MANQNWGIKAVEALQKLDVQICSVYTHPDNMDKYDSVWYDSVTEYCEQNSIPVEEISNLENSDFKKIIKMEPDILFSVNWRRLLPKELFTIPKLGSINIHPSLLPKYRGMSPINWVILNGEQETGITIHYIDEFADTGKIILQEKIPISFNENAFQLYTKILNKYPELITKAINLVKTNSVKPIDQKNLKGGFFVSKRFPNDGKIFWNFDRMKLYNQIRALCDPYPNAFFNFNNQKICVKVAKLSEDDYRGPPGRICSINQNGIIITCGTDHRKNQGLLITKMSVNDEIINPLKFFKLWNDLM